MIRTFLALSVVVATSCGVATKNSESLQNDLPSTETATVPAEFRTMYICVKNQTIYPVRLAIRSGLSVNVLEHVQGTEQQMFSYKGAPGTPALLSMDTKQMYTKSLPEVVNYPVRGVEVKECSKANSVSIGIWGQGELRFIGPQQ